MILNEDVIRDSAKRNPHPFHARMLAQYVVQHALANLRAKKRATGTQDGAWNPCTGHALACYCGRCASDFLCGHLADDAWPCNFVWCCMVLQFEIGATISALRSQHRDLFTPLNLLEVAFFLGETTRRPHHPLKHPPRARGAFSGRHAPPSACPSPPA